MYSFPEYGGNKPQQPAGRVGGRESAVSQTMLGSAAAAGAGGGIVENEGAGTASGWLLRSLPCASDEGEIRKYLLQVGKDNGCLVGVRQWAFLVRVTGLIVVW